MAWKPAALSARVATLVLAAGLALAVPGAPAAAQQVPATPDPVPVSLEAASTALAVLDVSEQPCGAQPNCTAMVPRIAALLASARAAGVLVVYSTPTSAPPILPAVAPAPDDLVVRGQAQDRFFNTPLDENLQAHGITTLVLVGWRENGSVLYTAVGATIRGYTVVVADDGTSASQDYDVAIGRYQLLTQLNANPTNEPLRKAAATLSRTDLISFG
jgi:nicotinamidase-related amidase